MTDWDKPCDVKELAAVLGRSRSYLDDMKTCGFIMPGGRATLRMAFGWLANHEEFNRRAAAKVRFARRKTAGGRKRKQIEANGSIAGLA